MSSKLSGDHHYALINAYAIDINRGCSTVTSVFTATGRSCRSLPREVIRVFESMSGVSCNVAGTSNNLSGVRNKVTGVSNVSEMPNESDLHYALINVRDWYKSRLLDRNLRLLVDGTKLFRSSWQSFAWNDPYSSRFRYRVT